MSVTVHVNDQPVELQPGMTVKHALLRAGLLDRVDDSHRPRDEWGNEMGLDGALSEGMKVYLE